MATNGRVAVVGGGITGLAAAYELTRWRAHVALFEASDRLGGKILSTPFAGRIVDEAADAFLARVPWAVELCDELGLRADLVSPAQLAAYVWWDGALRRLPAGLVLGVPTDLDALAASGIVSPAGVQRAEADLDVVDDERHEDESVGSLVRRRLGDEVMDRLVDPLLGGINAGNADHLSLAAGAPQLAAAAAEARGGSLIAALRSPRTPPNDGPVFFTLPGGVGGLVDALGARIGSAGASVALGHEVGAIARDGNGWAVDGEPFDAAVLATPAPAAATLLAPIAPAASDVLRGIAYASVVLVTLAYPADAVDRPLDASGFLVPRGSGLLLTACSWATSKWSHLDRGDGTVVVRASAGRIDDERARTLDDGSVVRRLASELANTMGIRRDPTGVRVSRWPRSLPQYAPGHLDRVAAVDRAVAEAAPGLAVAGAALRGLGVAACINQGREAARRVLSHLG